MIREVNGVEYNTETAVSMDSWRSNRPEGNPMAWAETLYRTPDGEHLFLYGEGGAESGYASGPRITPLKGNTLKSFHDWKYRGITV